MASQHTAEKAIVVDRGFRLNPYGSEDEYRLISKGYQDVKKRIFSLELVTWHLEKSSLGKEFLGQIVGVAKKENAFFGQRLAEALISDDVYIPASWRPYILLFPGTVWESPRDKCHIIPILRFLRRSDIRQAALTSNDRTNCICWSLSLCDVNKSFSWRSGVLINKEYTRLVRSTPRALAGKTDLASVRMHGQQITQWEQCKPTPSYEPTIGDVVRSYTARVPWGQLSHTDKGLVGMAWDH